MTTTTSSDLLSEIDRQKQYLKDLPPDYEFPLFSGRQAVESMRKSAYRNTARAAREIVDNALEAGAKNVHIIFERVGDRPQREKHERKNAVCAVAIVDDGPGMLPEMARYALSWGGGTHWKSPRGIGKFGFGLPNSSINQTRRVEVFTRVEAAAEWAKTYLDLDDVTPHGTVKVDPAELVEGLPVFVNRYTKRHKVNVGAGTVVVWNEPDRLTYRTDAQLREHLIEDFSVVYRYLLDEQAIYVDGVRVEKADPLFLTPGARHYLSPEEGGASCTFERKITVKLTRDPETGSHLAVLKTADDLKAARKEMSRDGKRSPKVTAIGTIEIKVARFPYRFACGKRSCKKKEDEAHRPAHGRFEIRKERRGISFVRADREIDTVDVFPKSARDREAGLGDWPLLQSYAYHWGVELRFGPELDEALGIGNDKQTIRPIEDFWRVLSEAEVDRALSREDAYQREVRSDAVKERAKAEREKKETTASIAAAQAKAIRGRRTLLPPERRSEARAALEAAQTAAAEAAAGPDFTDEDLENAKKAIEEEANRKKYVVEFFESEGGAFYYPSFGNGLQRVVHINTKHPFFEVFYSPAANLPDPRVRNAVDVLLFALADAELESGGQVKQMYEQERVRPWSDFLRAGLRTLDEMLRSDEEESGGNGDADDDTPEPTAT